MFRVDGYVIGVKVLVLRTLIWILSRTWRVEPDGVEHLEGLRRNKSPFVFALWHAELLPLVWHHRGHPTSIVVSENRDGSYLADAARSWGYRLIRGSSSRSGVKALRQMVRVLRGGGEVATTPDGPRGPSRIAKPGIVVAAQLTGAPILPVSAAASAYWCFRSWDGFMLPKPFARVRIVYGSPVHVPESSSRQAATLHLQHRLNTVARLARC